MVIVGEFIGGAALGAAFGVLFDVVQKAVDKPTTFKSLLENIKFSLDFLKPVIENIGQHNVELGLPDEEIKYLVKEMEEGVNLIQKSSKVSKWNCKKSYYTDQLIELDGSLKRLLQILMVQGVRDAKETLILARKHQDQRIESARDAKETLVLAQKNTDQLIESAKDGKETLVLARQNNDQLVASAGDAKETLVLAQKNTDHLIESAKDGKETLVLARQNNDQLVASARDAKETLVLAQKNTDQLIESAKDGKETLVLARQNNDQLVASARNGKETLVLARKIKRMLKRIDCLVPACTNKGKTRYRRGNRVSKGSKSAGRSHILETSNFRVFTLEELKTATGNFSPDGIIGEGGFGTIFRGWVDEKTLSPSKAGTGMIVAIKRYSESNHAEGVKVCASEVNILGKLSHPNLVKLLGCCFEKKKTLLVYEFVQRGSLDNHLFRRIPDKEPPSWDNRLKIAIGAARGLTFLHSLQIIHRNVTPSHILLDGDYNPKITSFSLATWGPADGDSHVSTRVCGTLGYLDPEYLSTGRLYVKSDVYSFGVVLLQILTGLRAIDFSRLEDEEEVSLVDWAIRLLCDETELQIIMDKQIKGQYSPQEALQTAHLALKCLQRDPESRPSMKEVAEELACVQAMKEKPNQFDPGVEEVALQATAARLHGAVFGKFYSLLRQSSDEEVLQVSNGEIEVSNHEKSEFGHCTIVSVW